MGRITTAFESLPAKRSRGLVAYLTAGDPHPDRTVELIEALEAGGSDILELGVPFSDPIADGPVIQAASERALAAGTNLADVLEIVRQARRRSELPIVLFSYLNPVLRYGFERFAAEASDAGADGALLTDLNIEAAGPYTAEMRRRGLDTVFLASQTTSDDRLRQVAEASSGFLYLVSTAGVTGMRQTVSSSARPLLERARRVTQLPLAVGFGLSSREHMQAVAPYADAAVVGSAIMRLIGEFGQAADLSNRLQALAKDLKAGLQLNGMP